MLVEGDVTKIVLAEEQTFRTSAETLALRAESHIRQREYMKNREAAKK